MQLKSRQAITRLRAMKTKVIGFENTIECAVEAITELEQQLADKEVNLKIMNQQWLDAVAKNADLEDKITELQAEIVLRENDVV